MGVKERLREYIKTLNISEREFCRRIGVSSSYVNNIRQSIQPDKMKAIGEQFPELNPKYYGDMPEVVFNALEAAFISGAETAIVPKAAFEMMLRSFENGRKEA
jgi:transcriptional regulator with XRE-family HTH domain